MIFEITALTKQADGTVYVLLKETEVTRQGHQNNISIVLLEAEGKDLKLGTEFVLELN